MLSRVHEIGIFGMSLRGLRSVVGVVKRCHINIAHRYTDLSRPGHAQTRTSMARRPSTVPSGASSVKITWTGRRLRPPTHELKQWNSSSDVTQSAPAIYIQQHTHTHTHTHAINQCYEKMYCSLTNIISTHWQQITMRAV